MALIRKATLQDVKEIHSLLHYFAKKGDLLSRPLSVLYEKIREFMVYEEDNQILGFGALAIMWEDLAEIRSLAVREEHQRKNIGKKIVESLLEEAKQLKIKRVFTLTYQVDFFRKMGFVDIDKNQLPHKIWTDCINCPYFPNCNENALIKII